MKFNSERDIPHNPVPYYYRSAARLLYAIAMEVGLKALWEIDNNGQEARHTHNILEIFAGLRTNRQESHRRWYDLIARSASSPVCLDAALKENTDMVRKFKYGDHDDGTPSVVGGEIVDGAVVGGGSALISYGQFVIDDLENTVLRYAARAASRSTASNAMRRAETRMNRNIPHTRSKRCTGTTATTTHVRRRSQTSWIAKRLCKR